MKRYVAGSFQMYPAEKPKYSWLDKNIVNALQRKVETPPSLLEWSQLTVMHVTQLVRRQLILGCYSVCLDAAGHFHWKSDSGIYLKFVITMTTQFVLGGNESFHEEETFKFLHREYQEREHPFSSVHPVNATLVKSWATLMLLLPIHVKVVCSCLQKAATNSEIKSCWYGNHKPSHYCELAGWRKL